MKTRIHNSFAVAIAALTIASASVRAQVVTSDPSLPVLYPNGFYTNLLQFGPSYHGPAITIVLQHEQHRAFGPVIRSPSGPNQIENFGSQLLANMSVNGSPIQPVSANGPVTTEVFGKIGNVTGTFNTEMLSMSLNGSSPFGPFMIRESPTLASLGQTTITDIGGGLFRIDSFFDVFTELSIDGGNSWIPSDSSTRVTLESPEPST